MMPFASRIGSILAAALSALAPAWGVETPAPFVPSECRQGAARTDSLVGLGDRGEIRLASGARAVLESLRWPDEAAASAAAGDWLLARRDKPLDIVVRGEPDRWGRTRVDAALVGEAVDLAGALIGDGLALADAGERDTLCRPALLRVEEGARTRKIGLWREAMPEARDGAALRRLEGRFAVVQGRIRHVGERAARTYLDFGRRGEDALTVTVSKRTWRRMRERGLSAAALEGRVVRVRGVIKVRRGPVIEPSVPETIELVEGEAAVAVASRRRPGPDGDSDETERNGERAPRR